jgi:hypothetical protein
MRKGKMIIGLSGLFWFIVLVFITFISHNPYVNTLGFFFGAMITVCGLGCGCEAIEKAKASK